MFSYILFFSDQQSINQKNIQFTILHDKEKLKILKFEALFLCVAFLL